MSSFKSDNRLNGQDEPFEASGGDFLNAEQDMLMEHILENINSTPIGQVLKKIASLPEIRQRKVLDLRRQLTSGKYDVSERLDIALDRVLEDLTT